MKTTVRTAPDAKDENRVRSGILGPRLLDWTGLTCKDGCCS